MKVPTPHNNAQKGEIAKLVLMPGDPLRAKFIAETFFTSPKLFNNVRNMFGYTGTYKGKTVSVMGSGMGMPSFALYATELYEGYDVEKIIRVGSTGALQPEIKVKDIVIAMAASTDSGMATPKNFPGVLAPAANYELLAKAVAAATAKNIRAHVGTVFSSDYFYAPEENKMQILSKTGHLAIEMETAALYILAQRFGKKALSILTVSDSIVTSEELSAEERQTSFTDMIEVALEAGLA